MRTRINKYGTQDERSAGARAKLLDATIVLIGSRGPLGFSLEQVGDQAKVSRSLARHHFGSREQLLEAAVGLAVVRAGPERHYDLGLPGLLDWLRYEVDRADAPALRCLLTLKVVPCPVGVVGLVAQHTEAQAAYARHHLERAGALEQVRSDIVPDVTAPLLIAQLHGELMRLAAGGVAMTNAFIDLVRHALLPVGGAAPRRKAPRQEPQPSGPAQNLLF